jgi:ABC-type transport system substrate-binding protein
MVLGWHTNIAPRWLEPLQHDGGATTPDNFLNVVQDGLIKNFRDRLYDHLALAEHFEFAEDARSAAFRLRPNLKFHNGAPVTPQDVKWGYENYHGAWAAVLHDKTDGIEITDDWTIRFNFKRPFLGFSAPDRHGQRLPNLPPRRSSEQFWKITTLFRCSATRSLTRSGHASGLPNGRMCSRAP